MVAVHVNPNISYSRFAGFLHSFGFATEEHGDHVRLVLHEHDIVLTMRKYGPDELVSPHQIMAARKMMDERGVFDEEHFDHWLLAAMRTVAA
ncbi:MAG: hypothetical protein AAF656_10800 [Planctomycetota bacterium]